MSSSTPTPSPYLLLVITALFWSSNVVLGRALHEDIPPITLAFWRWTLALLMLAPFAARHLLAQRQLLVRHWRILLVLGVLGVNNFNTFVYIGVQSTTATNAVLLISTTPVLIVALAFMLLGHRVTPRQGTGILISLLGVVIIIARGQLDSLLALQLNRGDLWVMAAVLSWALYSVCLHWRPPGLHPLAFLAATMVTGLAVLTPLYGWELASGRSWPVDLPTVAAVLYIALGPSVLAFVFWNRAVAELGPGRTGQFIHLMPAFGALLSMLVLGERLHTYHGLGIALIAVGIVLTTVRRQWSRRRP